MPAHEHPEETKKIEQGFLMEARCWFGLHPWGRWYDAGEVEMWERRIRPVETERRTVGKCLIQTRECLRCFAKQARRVRL